MPYSISPRPNGKFEVLNSDTGRIHSIGTTSAKAHAQIRLLRAIEHNPHFKVYSRY